MRGLQILVLMPLLAVSTKACQSQTDILGGTQNDILGDAGNYVTADVDFKIAPSEMASVRRRAAAGDVNAARDLSYHYEAVGDPAQSKRYAILAASRGDCVTLLNIPGNPSFSGTEKAKWAAVTKRHKCTGEDTFGLTVHED
jgi:hypothetical protein